MNRAERIKEQLGMPQGTAANKLRKSLLFAYVKRANDDVCHKCGEIIETVEDFSIEHKEPWEGRDAGKFWALDNIAFSHVQCNRPHTRTTNQNRIIKSPEGMNWCGVCKDFLPVEKFSKSKHRVSGYHHRCKDHEHLNRKKT